MIVEIENIGLLEKTEVQVNGLTVIAGINDAGKSTLGKVIFSVIHGLKSYQREQEEHREEQVSSHVDEVFFLLRRLSFDLPNKDYIEKMFFPPAFNRDIKDSAIKAVKMRLSIVESLGLNDRFAKIAMNRLNSLLNIVSSETSEKEMMKNAIERALRSEFHGQLSSKFNSEMSKIKFRTESGITLVDIKISDSSILDIYIKDDLLYSDVTFIDSPVIMQLSHLIKGCTSNFSSNNVNSTVPLHWKDLNKKLIASKYKFEYIDNEHFFGDLIGGQIEYDEDAESFQYDRVVANHKFDVRAINMASGIKALSILNLLISSGQLSTGSFLIIDEPEVNLHPEWQVEYAKVISKLASFGVTIIVTTHSPYIVEALKTFDKIDEIGSKFFVANKKANGVSALIDYTNNVSGLIGSLAAPLDKLHQMHMSKAFDDL
ncbi:AAA family ATPase [Vibrio splendidus]|uniref:AAA family ATPase n=1 Tax=Vibrio splendidus TaxID=29497 RepID=UPI00076AAFC8|nr:AAA family ATPase [Vibrio splendidus]